MPLRSPGPRFGKMQPCSSGDCPKPREVEDAEEEAEEEAEVTTKGVLEEGAVGEA